jgi:hypothetical protein
VKGSTTQSLSPERVYAHREEARRIDFVRKTSRELRGRLLAAGLETLDNQFADKGTGARIVLERFDKEVLSQSSARGSSRSARIRLSRSGAYSL